MYYFPNPRFFRSEEFFPKTVCDAHITNENSLWRLMDNRVLWTAEALRKRFGVMYINNWFWGGQSHLRAYRPAIELLDKEIYSLLDIAQPMFSSFTSQHCLGRAVDCHFRDFTAEEVREDIRKNPNRSDYQYITCIENNVEWLHFDSRAWNREKNGILYVNP